MPIPVSRTVNFSRFGCGKLTSRATSPCSVNLIALLRRFTKIWRRLVESAIICCGTFKLIRADISKHFCEAAEDIKTSTSSTNWCRLKTFSSRSRLPDSICEKSRILLITDSNASPPWRIIDTYCCCWMFKAVLLNSPAIPITAFIGVRNSWLIAAKNSLLALFAASATLAAASLASFCFLLVTSSMVMTNWTGWLFPERMRLTRHMTSTELPLGCIYCFSRQIFVAVPLIRLLNPSLVICKKLAWMISKVFICKSSFAE